MKMFCPKGKDCVVICGIHKQEHTKVLSCDKLGYDGCPACVPIDSLLELSKENNRRFGAKDSEPVYGGFHLCGKCLQPIANGEAEHKHPELSKSKEELIEGLAKILYIMQSNLIESKAEEIWERAKDNVARGDWRNASRGDAGKVLAYLKSYGFGDIEKAKTGS